MEIVEKWIFIFLNNISMSIEIDNQRASRQIGNAWKLLIVDWQVIFFHKIGNDNDVRGGSQLLFIDFYGQKNNS